MDNTYFKNGSVSHDLVIPTGDTVLIPAPYWPSYPDMVKMCGGVPVAVETLAADGYTLSGSALRSALDAHPGTSCLILCNPSNPTGCVAGRSALEDIAHVLADFPKVCPYLRPPLLGLLCCLVLVLELLVSSVISLLVMRSLQPSSLLLRFPRRSYCGRPSMFARACSCVHCDR